MEESKPDSYFSLTKKKGHDDSVLSVDVLESNNNILLTASEDHTMRLWDLRLNSSVKRLTCPEMKEKTLSNGKFSFDGNTAFAGLEKEIVQFDLKTDKILVESCTKIKESTRDEINYLNVSADGKYLATCDDSGDISIFTTSELNSYCTFKDVHTNIPFTLDFIYPPNKEPICISSGFDCQLIFWNLETKNIMKIINVNEILAKYIPGQLFSIPLVYNISVNKATICVSVETGHVMAINYKEPKKPKYIFDAHLSKVQRATHARYDENILVTVGNDMTFALWNTGKRDDNGLPIFIRRVEIENKPNWIETTKDKKILVTDTSEYLYIYTLKEA